MKTAILSIACVAGLALTADSAKAGGFDVIVKFPTHGRVIRTYYPPVYAPYYPPVYTPYYPPLYTPAPIIVTRPVYPVIVNPYPYPYQPTRLYTPRVVYPRYYR